MQVSYLTETMLGHAVDLTDKILDEPEKAAGCGENQQQIGRRRQMGMPTTRPYFGWYDE